MVNLLDNLKSEIHNIFSNSIETTKSYSVPSRDDTGLTFPIGDNKRGKLIETCVLFVDIRNSTILSQNLRNNKNLLGKIYSAFIHSMTSIADEFGYVRNIVGDRVMVVFEPGNCFKDSIYCAALMFGVAREIIAPYCKPARFKVGIGIDFGEMLILKTGIRKKYKEQSEYKNLVWIGDAANIASKLTDFANKTVNINNYKISLSSTPINIGVPDIFKSKIPFSSLFERVSPQTQFLSRLHETENTFETVSLEDLHINLNIKDGRILFKNRKVNNLEFIPESKFIPPVLISGKVLSKFRKAFPKSALLRDFRRVECHDKPNTGSGIFGGGFILENIINN